MSSIKEKFLRFWYFHCANPVVRKGEMGGFKWKFRRFSLEISTLSGNFKAKFTASEHPFGYLIASQDDENIHGFCQVIYYIGSYITSDAKFASEIGKVLNKYMSKKPSVKPKDDEVEEMASIEEVKAIQEYVERKKK